MSTHHTPGKLRVHKHALLAEDGFYLTGTIVKPDDARRLVACWNACEGIPTESLETMMLQDVVSMLLDSCEAALLVIEKLPSDADIIKIVTPLQAAMSKAKAATPAA